MKIIPIDISVDGPGIDLTNQPDGLSIKMADPVKDFAYARNAVTLTYDLAGYSQIRLAFKAMEYGDEPHAPPPSPFTGKANFDGVAVSEDGVAWYEVQDLRHLRSDRFTAFDIDLDAAIAGLNLTYGSAFAIRFCQYDNNPAPMDGVFLHAIELTGEPAVVGAPVFHLPMNDNAASPTVRDIAAGGLDQVFFDPSGDPNTAAHSVPGPNAATALAFDGVDDRIDFGPELLGDIVGEGDDFTIAFWYASADPGGVWKHFVRRAGAYADPHIRIYATEGRICWEAAWSGGFVTLYSPAGVLDSQWRHVVCRRQGQSLSLWVDGTVQDSQSDPAYAGSFFSAWDPMAIGVTYSGTETGWPFAMADFRAYDRAISDEEIAELSA